MEQEAAEPRDGITPRPEVILTTDEESKAQKALAARNRGREQNKLRMRRVKEA